ncbi:hypothetical protein ACRAWD_22445 [Caulobacter segnis]
MMTGMLDASARTEAVFDLLDKRKAAEPDKSDATAQRELEAYAGLYSAQPWASEIAVALLGRRLGAADPALGEPRQGLSVLESAGKDAFWRQRDDGSNADLVRFTRDGAGKVVGFQEFGSIHQRLGDLPPINTGAARGEAEVSRGQPPVRGSDGAMRGAHEAHRSEPREAEWNYP